MKKIVLIKILLLFTATLSSQELEITWQSCFGGTDQEIADDIINTTGGYLIVGSARSTDGDISFNHGGDDVWIIKVDTIGNLVWEKCLGGSNGDGALKILNSGDGNYYILAIAFSSDGDISNDPYFESSDYWIIKVDAYGDIIWEKIVGSNGLNLMQSGTATNDGGILAIGWSNIDDGDVSIWYGAYDMWMIKLNSEGNIEWEFTLGGPDFDLGHDIIQTSDGGYLVAGSAIVTEGGNLQCNSHGLADAVLVKLDSARNIEWQQCYGGNDYDGATNLLETDGGYIFAGYVHSFDGDVNGFHGATDVWVVKIDKSGTILWQNPLGGSNMEYPDKILETPSNDIVLWGGTQSHDGDVEGNHSISEHDSDIWYVKLDQDGQLMEQKCFGGKGSEELGGAIMKNEHNFVVAGRTDRSTHDVQCDLEGFDDVWVFEVKDCSLYAPQTPTQPAGPDTLCHTTEQITNYQIQPALRAWDYEWQILPEEAGTITADTLNASIAWNQTYEGEVSIQVRSYNDCGNSEWSEVKKTFVYNCVGVEELTAGKLQLKVYPNPAKDKVVFDFEEINLQQNPQIIISSLSGHRIAEFPVLQNKTTWDVSRVEKGMYFYTIITDGGSKTGKVVILD